MPGVCKHCGCTDASACAGGCCWVTSACDLCSGCLPRLPYVELAPLLEHELKASRTATVEVPILAIFTLVGFAQLGIAASDRNSTCSAQVATDAIRSIIESLRMPLPAVADAIRRVCEAQHDVPRDSTAMPH